MRPRRICINEVRSLKFEVRSIKSEERVAKSETINYRVFFFSAIANGSEESQMTGLVPLSGPFVAVSIITRPSHRSNLPEVFTSNPSDWGGTGQSQCFRARSRVGDLSRDQSPDHLSKGRLPSRCSVSGWCMMHGK